MIGNTNVAVVHRDIGALTGEHSWLLLLRRVVRYRLPL